MVQPVEQVTDVIIREGNVVYPKDFFKEFCTSYEGYTIQDYQACVLYAQTELHVSYLSLFFGLLVGFIIAKAVADGWN